MVTPCRNLNYWDSVSTLAGEVPQPAKTFPKALFGAVVLVVTTYALPLIVGLGVTSDIADWKLGYFASLAKQVQYSSNVISNNKRTANLRAYWLQQQCTWQTVTAY